MALKLSIITVNLNNASGLYKTIESVVSQSFTDFEFIVIDGASTDGSIKIIKEFSEKIAFWVTETDKGIYHAMNKGIGQAKGEYCLFLNSGDYLVSVNILKQAFDQNFSEDIVVGDCNISKQGAVIFNAAPPDLISFQAFFHRNIPHQSAFIRRDLFNRLGYYSEEYYIHSDKEFFIRALILNNCTYRHLPVTITDYNLEGLSSDPSNKLLYEEENQRVLSQMIPSRIIQDYASWEKERDEMKALYWIKNKPLLYKPLTWIFLLATYFVSRIPLNPKR